MTPLNRSLRRRVRCVSAFVLAFFVPVLSLCAQDRAAWMKQARWGVMNHYLADWIARREQMNMNVQQWNDLVDHFHVEGLARQIKSVGAGYYLITIGQNSGYYLSPNATYDRFVGIAPSKCARRDLVADLYEALHQRGIKLMVYLPSGAPSGDRVALSALQWQNGAYRNREFQLRWEQVIREWSRPEDSWALRSRHVRSLPGARANGSRT
jgi:hypothetical protein